MKIERIMISPGHGFPDEGAGAGTQFPEKDYNLQQTEVLDLLLHREGFTTKWSRLDDYNVDEKETAERANRWPSDLLISIHANGFSDPSVSGAEVLYWNTSNEGRILAQGILDGIAARFPEHPIRRLKPIFRGDRGQTILRRTIMPAVLVEAGFITSPKDKEMLRSFSNQALISEAILEGIQKLERGELS